MNTASRLEALSRDVEGGFLASRAALDKFAVLPSTMRPLGQMPIRGRAGGIEVAGLGSMTVTEHA
jgi:adenylate cyclase